MRKIFLIFLMVLAATFTSAQTTVNLQVTDTGGQTWNNGSWSAVLVPTPGTPGPPYFLTTTTTPVPNQIQQGTLSGSGAASFTEIANSSISPQGSAYRITVCPAATANCFTQQVMVNTSSPQALTIAPPPISVLMNPAPIASAYVDNEVIGGVPGSSYYNLTISQLKVCTTLPCSSNWNIIGGGGGSPPCIAQGTSLQYNNSGSFGCVTGLTFASATLTAASTLTIDFSAAAHTLPNKVGAFAAIPATCKVGESYFANDVTAGQNNYGCTAPNVWTQEGGGGGGGGGNPPFVWNLPVGSGANFVTANNGKGTTVLTIDNGGVVTAAGFNVAQPAYLPDSASRTGGTLVTMTFTSDPLPASQYPAASNPFVAVTGCSVGAYNQPTGIQATVTNSTQLQYNIGTTGTDSANGCTVTLLAPAFFDMTSPSGAAGAPSNVGTTSGTIRIANDNSGASPVLKISVAGGSFTAMPVSASAPLAISATGALNITGVAGQVLAGSTPAFTATPVLGVNATTAGSLGIASSAVGGQTVTLQYPTGNVAYNFNFPLGPGTAGQCFQSGGGGSAPNTWGSCGAGGTSSWSGITDPTGNVSHTMGANTSTFNYNTNGSSADMYALLDTGTTGTGILLHLQTANGSSEIPFQADRNGNGIKVGAGGVLTKVGGGAIDSAALTNSSTTVNSQVCGLGASCNITLDAILSPVLNATFTVLAGNVVTFNGTAPASSSGAGTTGTSIFSLTNEVGGATTGTSTTAGAGATLNWQCGGTGGSAAGGTTATGGAGGGCTFTAGNGGASATGGTNGSGGGFLFNLGVPGSGGTVGSPVSGTFVINTNGAAATADLVDIQSNGTNQFQFLSSGGLRVGTAGFQLDTIANGQTLTIGCGGGGNAACSIVLRPDGNNATSRIQLKAGNASPTADIVDIVNSSGTNLAGMGPNGGYGIAVTNAGTTGTTVNLLAKLTGAPSTGVIAATTDTGGVVGVVVSGAGTTGVAIIVVEGIANCIADNATTAGDYVQIGTTTGGRCKDAGSTRPGTGEIIGRFLASCTVGTSCSTWVHIEND